MKKELILSCQIPDHREAVIREIKGDHNVVGRLREIGFYEGMIVSKFYSGDENCIILNIKGNKIYLNEVAAHCILVEVL